MLTSGCEITVLKHSTTQRGRLLTEPRYQMLKGMENHLHIAMSSEPLTHDAAKHALSAARNILATLAVKDVAKG